MYLTVDDAVGFLAAATMIVAFCSRRMIPLRIAAILANLLFIAYALRLGLMPVLALHCILMPLNVLRLVTALRDRQACSREAPGERLRKGLANEWLHQAIRARRLP